jgi:hypothetical protein
MLSVEVTEKGYLHLPADLAQRYFPNDALVAMVRDGELWLLPTRGAAAGGLWLKQRNRHGDRSVLIWDMLPPGTLPGWRAAHWDDERGMVRVALRDEGAGLS